MALTWTQVAQFASPNLPNDITANSVSVAPVSGDATPVGIKLGSGSATLFSVDAAGNLSAAASSIMGNETVSGTSSISGLLTAAGNVATPLVKTSQAPTSQTVNSGSYTVSNVQLPGSFGDGNSYPLSGMSSDALGNLSLNYQGVAAIKMANTGYSSQTGNSPNSAFLTTFASGSYAFNAGSNTQLAISGSAVKFGYTANTVPVTMQAFSGNILNLINGGSSPSFTAQTVGAVDSSGNATFAGVMKSASVTFGDGTSQTTAYTSANANNQAKWVATSNGTTALPAFTYTNNTDTGAYLKTSSTSAAVLGLSVNATDAMTLTKTGVSVPGTLAVSGATTAAALTASGLITAANVTLASGGKITYADGTTQSTAPSATGAGSSATFTATSNGTVSSPAFTFTNNTDSGMYLATASTTSAVVNLSVNGTSVLSLSKALGNTVPVNTTFSANVVHNSTTTLAGATQFNATLTSGNQARVISTQGTASAPAFADTNAGNMGPFYQSSGANSIYNISVNGASVTQTGPTYFNVTGNSTITGNLTSNSQILGPSIIATDGNGSATSAQFANSARNTGLFVNTTGSANVVGLTATGTSVLNATSTLLTLPLPTTHSATVTSTTANGTPSFVSSQGFKLVQHAMYWNKSYTANNLWTCYDVQQTNDGASAGSSDFRFVFPYAGSVTALTLSVSGTTTGTNSLYIYKNGSSLYQWSPGSGANTSTPYYTTFAKGTYAFAAGDVLTLQVANSTSGEIRMLARAFIEVGA